MSEKRIALIGFGGTIAMKPDAKGTLVPAMSAEELVEQAPGIGLLDADLDIFQLTDKDSTNLFPEDWQQLIDKIAELHPNYDGIVVTHGTDTMPYTATAASLALGSELSIPIVFTGSQVPMGEPGSDARMNLERSMSTAVEAARQEVTETMIVFYNRVLRGARALKVSGSDFDAFASPAFEPIAKITALGSQFIAEAFRKRNLGLPVNPRSGFDNGIASMDVRPGLDPDIVRTVAQSQKCTALILKSLGVGSVPALGESSLIPVIAETVEGGKPVIIATKFVGGKTEPEVYEPGRAALEAGAGHAGNMTDVATEVKLMWLMGQGLREPEKVNEAMLKSYVGELD